MPKVTQKQRVLDAMRNHSTKSISPWYAIQHLGNTRLAASIYLLKKDGHVISSVTETGTNRFGDSITYARYFLIQEAK
mgnify:CR=1 FL=1|tara:strand:+ start:33828 stop:34061 length:234 start_codon:yes stop_codon:yes gene_type:complete